MDTFRYFKKDFDSSWKDEEDNLKKLGVIFKSGWCHGFRVIPRENNNPLIEMLCEDDGQLFSTGICFDVLWTNEIIEALQETIKYCEGDEYDTFKKKCI